MFKNIIKIAVGGGGPANRKPPSLDRQLEQADNHLKNFDSLIAPAPESKPRTSFEADIPPEEMSMLNFTPSQKLKVVSKAVPLMINMQLGARMYDGRFQPSKNEATPEFIAELEAMAFALGAKDIDYVKVPPNAIFQGKGFSYSKACR